MKVFDVALVGSVLLTALPGCESVVSGKMAALETTTGNVSPGGSAGNGGAGSAPAGAAGSTTGAGGEGNAGADNAGGAGGTIGNSGGSGGMLPTGGSGGMSGVSPSCPTGPNICVAAVSSEHLPGRPIVSRAVTAVTQERVTVGDIYARFLSSCGRCHGPTRAPDASNGFWVPTSDTFAADPNSGDEAIARITSELPDVVMPPLVPASQRDNPGVDALLLMLEEWLEAGKLADGYLRDVAVDAGAHDTYRYPDAIREDFSNIGNCIPARELVGCASDGRAEQLDQLFASVTSFADLPKRLEETDMISFDSAVLAPQGVLSFAPTYTLFSDHAKKMRHIRVPRGTTVRYDPAIKDFVIPPNTRFYKTFLKPVVDEAGNKTYRKIETRIIISRPDRVEGGRAIPTAVFGSYRWSLDESRAELIEEPYNDGRPFKDTLLEYVTDEKKAREIIGPNFDPNTRDGIIAASQVVLEGPLVEPRLTRHYGIPGADRCVQCHMGSLNGSFILGFTPFHADRRSYGEGGTFDQPPVPEIDYGADELSQLERFISYGIITNIRPGELKLEAPQAPYPAALPAASRPARSPEELLAQGYMMGNCAFCHNPRGFPSVQNPPLKDKLDFFPKDGGGIFGFPLERSSPRTFRTEEGNVEFPYITPSLFDRVPSSGNSQNITPKMIIVSALTNGTVGEVRRVYIQAPWRSLIYRNVSTPFTYSHDKALHPHMPLNVPGFDCRAPRIMAEWMLSVPSRLKAGAIDAEEEDAAQPWEEVRPVSAQDPGADFLAAKAAAGARLIGYRQAEIQRPADPNVGYLSRYTQCPDQSDVVAPEMMRAARPTLQPSDAPVIVAYDHPVFEQPLASNQGTPWADSEPDRPHWLDRDMSDPQGEQYVPRRSDWQAAIRNEALFMPPACPPSGVGPVGCIPDIASLSDGAQQRERDNWEPVLAQARRVFALQKDLRISDELRRFALRAFPFGLWATGKPTAAGEAERCARAVASSPKAKNLVTDAPLWLDEQEPDPEALVYSSPPGEIMFNQICSNCHGVEADSQSLLSNTILEMTGGRTRVANLRDGLFGQGGKRRAEADPQVRFTNDDDAGRYVVWMGLGGTTAVIPDAVLSRVGNTRPLGVPRTLNPVGQKTPNMLSNAVGFCQHSIGRKVQFLVRPGRGVARFQDSASQSSLVTENGDAELWLRLCSLDNPPPIRVVQFGATGALISDAFWPTDGDGRSILPSDVLIGTERGTQKGLRSTNLFPWCFRRPAPADEAALRKEWGPGEIPICDDALFVEVGGRRVQSVYSQADPGRLDLVESAQRWATRGAMNIGLSVFLYLDAKSRGEVQSMPPHDACAL